MSQSSPLKEEIKKSVVSEPIKILIGSLLTLVGTLVLAAIPQVRAHIWPAIPKLLLLALSVALLSVILGLVPYVLHLRRKAQAVTMELESLKAKPTYPYKFGVKWDNELNPLCPHCEAYLSGYQFVQMNSAPDLSRFSCGGCNRIILMSDKDADPIHFQDARDEMIAQAKNRLDP